MPGILEECVSELMKGLADLHEEYLVWKMG